MQPIVVSLGDPAGIGPEILAKAWMARELHALPPFFGVGDPEAIAKVWRGPLATIGAPEEASDVFRNALPIIALPACCMRNPGEPSIETAQSSLTALELSVGIARSGAASALVTGPVAKAQLYAIGFTHPGQTEFIAERCGIAHENAVMLLASRALRVVPITVHIPLAEVAATLTTELIVSRGRAAARGLVRDFGIARPRIAVAGLNPHAGEDGALGDEESRVIAPALEMLRAEGWDVSGPISPDSLFTARAREGYDLALCMYHDQALIPLKALYFDEGVNMTLGLPLVRTSPDHGTAFDLAGKGLADPGAMIAAIKMAASAAHHRMTEV